MERAPEFTKEQIAAAQYYASLTPPFDLDPRIASLVRDLIGRVADKWTMLILDVLAEKSPLRFSRLAELVEGISQKMLTQTLRAMERDGLVIARCIRSCRQRSNTSLQTSGSHWAPRSAESGCGQPTIWMTLRRHARILTNAPSNGWCHGINRGFGS